METKNKIQTYLEETSSFKEDKTMVIEETLG